MKQSDESIQVPAENNPVYVPHLSQMAGVVIKPNFSKKEKICYGARTLFKNGEIH